MKLMRLYKGSRAGEILRVLYDEGPKTRAELAVALNIEPVIYQFDIEKLRADYKAGDRAAPPRRTQRVYPYLPGTLSYMSKARYKKDWTEDWDKFVKFYKPWIWLRNSKWEITDYGVMALGVLDVKEEVNE